MAEPETDNLKPLDFVYCGKRVASGNKPAFAVLVSGEPNERLYDWHASATRRAVGGLYTGASFGAGRASGLNTAKFVRYVQMVNRPLLEAQHEEAELFFKTERLEADAKKINKIDELMLELRTLYANTSSRLDRAALQNAVLRSLLKPPKGK